MKTKLTIILLMLMSLSLWGQSQTDQEAILYRCLMQTEMVETNHLNSSGIPMVIVLDNGVVPSGQLYIWFGNPIELLSIDEIAVADAYAYVIFEVINLISTEKAEAIFSYICSGECSSWHYDLEFTKLDNQWYVSKNQTDLIE